MLLVLPLRLGRPQFAGLDLAIRTCERTLRGGSVHGRAVLLVPGNQTPAGPGDGDMMVAVLRSESALSIVVSLLGSFLYAFIIGYIQLMQGHLCSSGNVYTEPEKVALVNLRLP